MTRNQAMAGAAAGLIVGVVQGVVSVHRSRLRDGYDVAAEGLTHAGNGVILGLLGGVAASLASVSVAAVFAGRSGLAMVAPTAASAVVSVVAHERVDRLVRPWVKDFVRGSKPAQRRQLGLQSALGLPRS